MLNEQEAVHELELDIAGLTSKHMSLLERGWTLEVPGRCGDTHKPRMSTSLLEISLGNGRVASMWLQDLTRLP